MKTISAAAISALEGAVITNNELRLTGQLDRNVYVEVNAALEGIGGEWSRKVKAHLFAGSPADALDQILVDGGFHDTKRDFQQFFTPPALAERVVKLANVRGKTVLEPSAGEGALVVEAFRHGAAHVVAVEVHKDTANKCEDAWRPIVSEAQSGEVVISDFLEWSRTMQSMKRCFDRIVMNPPFTRQQDIAHVSRAFELLSPEGHLVAIMSAGAKFRTTRVAEDFRALVGRHGTMEDLPASSFRQSGTDVRAVLVALKR
jgi:predicted RNA methylase